MTAPLVPLALAFAGGIWLGLLAPLPSWVPGAGAGLGVLTVWAAARARLGAATAGLLLLTGLAGWARTTLPDPWPEHSGLRPGRLRVEALVTGDPEPDGPRTRLPLLVERVVAEGDGRPAAGTLLAHLYGPLPSMEAGQRVRVTLDLVEPRPFRNPGGALEDGRERRPVHFVAVGRADSLERVSGPGPPWWLRLRVQLHRVVQRELPPVSGALLEGLLVGERRQLPPTLLADFRTAGVFHILAVSGFNVGLVAGAVLVGLRALRIPPRGAAAGALAMLLGFAAVVGAQASVLRATIMCSLLLAARLIAREASVWNGLAAALLVLLALAPDALLDPGLQLSFGATAGILHLGPPIRRRLAAWGGGRVPRWLTESVAVSLGAQLAVTPIMIARWNQLSLIGVVANLVVVPLAALLTVLGFLAALLGPVLPTLAHVVFPSLWALLVALRWAVRGFAAVPGATVTVPAPPLLALVTMTGALLLVPLATRRARCLGVAALAVAAILATAWELVPDGRLHVLVLDVGQGDAILVRGPDGRALLVDTGGGGPGRLDRGEHVVLPVLRRLGVARLAALAVTHGDPDHAGGLGSLLAGMAVDEVWVPAGTEHEPWQAVADEAGVRRRSLVRGDRLWLGPLRIAVLNPAAPAPGDRRDARTTNNRSLVLRVEWGLAAAILTGDAESRAEQAMLAAAEPVSAPILKVGHHGSRFGSSSGFLQASGPRIAAISVGARNPFGHPSPAVLARLDGAGAALYRTDLDGAVEITSDAAHLWVRRWA